MKCRKGKECFDSHSRDMSRRVPIQNRTKANLFNYIPQACPEYKKQKKCGMGNKCYLAHGWLEIIFHPLLFKTKLCESSLKNGMCRKYGMYCAKAHNKKEVRNLISIYGKDWKRHYEAHQSESVKANKNNANNELSKYSDLSDSSCSSVLRVGDNVKSAGLSDDPVKANNNKAKHELSKHADLSDSSHSSGSMAEDNVKSAGLSHNSSQIYGGSPLFVPTPSVSPCQSLGVCSELVPIPSISLSDFDRLSSVECGEEGMYTKICNEGVASKTQGSYSLFNDCFPWEFDWSSSKDTSPKESVCSSSGSEDLESTTFKESGSCASGCTNRMSEEDTELLKIKVDFRFQDATGNGMTNDYNSSDDQAISRSLLDFDQQDWELRLRQDEHDNELYTDSFCPPADSYVLRFIMMNCISRCLKSLFGKPQKDLFTGKCEVQSSDTFSTIVCEDEPYRGNRSKSIRQLSQRRNSTVIPRSSRSRVRRHSNVSGLSTSSKESNSKQSSSGLWRRSSLGISSRNSLSHARGSILAQWPTDDDKTDRQIFPSPPFFPIGDESSVGLETEKSGSVWQSSECLWQSTETHATESVADSKVVRSIKNDDKQEIRGLRGVIASHLKLEKVHPL